MKSLLWREYRLNALVLIAGTVLLLLPYVFTSILLLWPKEAEVTSADVALLFLVAATISYSLSQLTIVFLGGNVFAGERADRSAEFLAYLPVSRERRLVSKLILAAAVTAVIWGINLFVVWVIRDFFPGLTHLVDPYAAPVGHTMLTGFVMFGVGWFISSLQSSPTFAVCAGIATPIVTLMGLYLTGYILSENLSREAFDNIERLMEVGYISISLVLGALGLGFGTWHFLKRVEP